MWTFVAQVVIAGVLLASVWVAWDHARTPLPWLLLMAGHGALLVYFAVTGQWGFWPLNAGMIAVGWRRWRMSLIRPARRR